MTTLITGANGFVGSALCERLHRDAVSLRSAVRELKSQPYDSEDIAIGSLSSETDWTSALRNAKRVLHLAARVHLMNDKSLDPLTEFRRVNVDGTLSLVRQAAAAGVKRFVFISSVKVNGESTPSGRALTEADAPNPQDAYGQSKHEAEQSLRQLSADTDISSARRWCMALASGQLCRPHARRAARLTFAAGRGAQPAQLGGA